jgi:hypothetical protein
MKTSLLFSVMAFLAFSSISCTDDDKIAAAIRDGEELNEGEHVPIMLAQNYPNPFNPTTMIGFSLSFPMHVRMTVYTEDWQEVTILVDGVLVTGFYQRSFDAGGLPSGEYYYTLEGSGITLVRRMRLIK